MSFTSKTISFVALVAIASESKAAFTIQYSFTNVSADNQAIFTQAKNFWESVITGYQDNVSRTLTINVSTFSEAAMGGGVTLGSAGPTFGTTTGTGHIVATEGQANFNTHPDAVGGSGLFSEATIRHEVGHILGIGTLWTNNNLYINGTGQYTGVNGLAGYNQEFGLNASFVPVELDGGGGTANGHWNESVDNFGIENSPGFDDQPGDEMDAPVVLSGMNVGESLNDALLTGVRSGSNWLSDTTIGSLQDLGFTTIGFNSVAVPEPSSSIFFSFAFSAILCKRRR